MSPNAIPPAWVVDCARVRIDDGVVVPRPRRAVLSFQKKLLLFCASNPVAVAKIIEPGVKVEIVKLEVVAEVKSPLRIKALVVVLFVVEALVITRLVEVAEKKEALVEKRLVEEARVEKSVTEVALVI